MIIEKASKTLLFFDSFVIPCFFLDIVLPLVLFVIAKTQRTGKNEIAIVLRLAVKEPSIDAIQTIFKLPFEGDNHVEIRWQHQLILTNGYQPL